MDSEQAHSPEIAGYPKGRRRRAEIVEAAFAEFSANGYATASMVQVAAMVGVSRAGLAHHFPTKESLLAAVLEERDRVNGELFWQGIEVGSDDADGIDYFRRLIATLAHNTTRPRAAELYSRLASEATDPDHPAHAYFAARYAWFRRDVSAALRNLAARGLIREHIVVPGLESDIIAFLDGIQLQWLLDPTAVDMVVRLRARLREIITVEID